MTKSDLIQQIAEKLKIPTARSENIINAIFGSMSEALTRDERIEIRGFGTFEVRSYKGYEGRNPKTGTPVQVEPKKLPFFKIGKDLHERLNREAGQVPFSDLEAETELEAETGTELEP